MNEIKLNYNGVKCWLLANGYGVPADFCIPLSEIARCDPDDVRAAMDWATDNREVLDRILFLSCGDVDTSGLKRIADQYEGDFIGRIAKNKITQHIEYQEWLEKNRRPKTRKSKRGYVYLAHAETGHYKIGKSKGPQDRIKAIGTIMPLSVNLVHSFPADDYGTAEAALHGAYANKHHEGEWFNLEPDDVENIRGILRYESGNFIY